MVQSAVCYLICDWGYSSAGRAPALHAGGQRFDPAYLHQIIVKCFESNSSKSAVGLDGILRLRIFNDDEGECFCLIVL